MVRGFPIRELDVLVIRIDEWWLENAVKKAVFVWILPAPLGYRTQQAGSPYRLVDVMCDDMKLFKGVAKSFWLCAGW